ncbi:MAG: energy-coupling factor transporter transmembrane component T [Coriobacteriia bacterium]|nr:energy-coupling factor transporter transmembrane component T [Coriobacteriia bacterium]
MSVHPGVRVLMLLAVSVSVLMADSWLALGLFAAALVAVALAMRVPGGKLLRLMVPAVPFVVLAVVFGMLGFDPAAGMVVTGDSLIGSLQIGARLLVLFAASGLFCLTSTAEEQMCGLRSLLSPFGKLGLPVDDVAVTLSLALRFIPQTLDQLQRVRMAQKCRGAQLDCGSAGARLKANAQCFVPLFVGMFRRADVLSQAMDARCYGGADRRSSLVRHQMGPKSVFALIGTVLLCVVVALL